LLLLRIIFNRNKLLLKLCKALSTLSQKSATVAVNGEKTATVAEFGDSRTFMRQCAGQGLTINITLTDYFYLTVTRNS